MFSLICSREIDQYNNRLFQLYFAQLNHLLWGNMSRRLTVKKFLMVLSMVVMVNFLCTTTYAADASLVHICIVPIDQDGTEHDPYLMTIRQSQIFGLVIPRDAKITVYGGSESPLAAAVYSITTDAQTGGYRRQSEIASSFARSQIPNGGSRPCSEEYAAVLTADLVSTVPIPVAANYALIVRSGEQGDLESQPFLGTFALHFMENVVSSNSLTDFQIIQLSEGSIDLSFPFLSSDTRFILIANTEVGIRRSFAAADQFLSLLIADTRQLFMQDLQRKSLDLFQIMDQGKVQIYPNSGLISEYPTGGFLKLEMSPDTPNRHFSTGDTIRPLAGTRANYFLPDRFGEVYGALLSPANTAQIAEIDNKGQLLITDPAGSDKVVIQAWLVELAS
jgi:hypothetical protein